MAMTTGPRIIPLALGLGCLLATASRADEAENAERLRSMPRERREALAKNLQDFDALGRDEQAALRQLDEQLAACAPADRARYLAVAHRYHLWLQTLTEEQRRALREAPPDGRLALVARYRAEQRRAKAKQEPEEWLQVSALNSLGLEASARQLAIWFGLDPADRKKVEQVRDPLERARELTKYARDLRIGWRARRVHQQFQAESEAVQAQVKRVEALKGLLAKNPAKAQAKGDRFNRMVEYRFLHKHARSPVSPEDLVLFEATMAPWVRESLDLLPPEAARLRLLILYRLVFPPGEEIPRPIPKAPASGATTSTSTPAPPKAKVPASPGSPF
jgi:hypothetical protein